MDAFVIFVAWTIVGPFIVLALLITDMIDPKTAGQKVAAYLVAGPGSWVVMAIILVALGIVHIIGNAIDGVIAKVGGKE